MAAVRLCYTSTYTRPTPTNTSPTPALLHQPTPAPTTPAPTPPPPTPAPTTPAPSPEPSTPTPTPEPTQGRIKKDNKLSSSEKRAYIILASCISITLLGVILSICCSACIFGCLNKRKSRAANRNNNGNNAVELVVVQQPQDVEQGKVIYIPKNVKNTDKI